MVKTIQVYNSLKNIILNNQVLPGERIYIESLSEKLKISTTPLREALNRLVQEGYIKHLSNRGYTIGIITPEEVENLYELCEALEPYAVEQAEGKITSSALGDLLENLSKYRTLLEGTFSMERFTVNREFHLKVAGLSGNEIILSNVKRAFERIQLKWRLENFTQGRGSEAYMEHEAVVRSLENGDVRDAAAKMRTHILHAKEHVMEYLRRKEELLRG